MSTGYSAAVPDDTALIDLLGALAYGELTAFDRLADDARMAPTLSGRAALCEMAAVEIGHYRLLADRIIDLGADSRRGDGAVRAGARRLPRDDVAVDLARGAGQGVCRRRSGGGLLSGDRRVRRSVYPRADSRGVGGLWHVQRLRSARSGPRSPASQRSRTGSSLWGRRLVGEAISQTQHVLAERDALTELLVAGTGDLLGVAALISRITDRHADRMT